MSFTRAFLALLLLPVLAIAATIYVPGNYANIDEAVDAARDGDVILVAAGTYPGCTFIMAGKDVSIIGAGAEQTTVDFGAYSGPTSEGYFTYENVSVNAVLEGLTIRDLNREFGSAVLCNSAHITIRNMVFHNNDSGGMFTEGPFTNGGALRCQNASPQITDCVFSANYAHYGGAVSTTGSSSPTFQDVDFHNNWGYRGGAFYINGGSPTIHNVRFRENLANWLMHDAYGFSSGWGGAIYDCNSSTFLADCSFESNVAKCFEEGIDADDGWGGAICAGGGASNYLNSTFYANRSEVCAMSWCVERGGTFCFMGGDYLIQNCIIAETTEGSGIYVHSTSSAPDLVCSDLWNNADGNFAGSCPDLLGINGNISADPQFCDAVDHDFSLANASPCLPAGNDCGVQMGAFGEGCILTDVDAPPSAFALGQNHPNPFNPTTEIELILSEDTQLSAEIFTLSGRRVRSLHSGEAFTAGPHVLRWDGLGQRGERLPSGVYFLRLRAAGQVETRKMTLLK